MSSVDDEAAIIAAIARAPKARPHRILTMLLAVLTAQYTLVTIIVSLSVAATLHYLVTPQIVAQFEMVLAALKR
jgi:hypothetical protein